VHAGRLGGVCRRVSGHGWQRAVPHEGRRPVRGIGLSAEAGRRESVSLGAADRTGPGRGRPEGDAMKPAATVARDAHQNSVAHDDRGVPVSMTVNARVRTMTVEPRTTLLD